MSERLRALRSKLSEADNLQIAPSTPSTLSSQSLGQQGLTVAQERIASLNALRERLETTPYNPNNGSLNVTRKVTSAEGSHAAALRARLEAAKKR